MWRDDRLQPSGFGLLTHPSVEMFQPFTNTETHTHTEHNCTFPGCFLQPIRCWCASLTSWSPQTLLKWQYNQFWHCSWIYKYTPHAHFQKCYKMRVILTQSLQKQARFNVQTSTQVQQTIICARKKISLSFLSAPLGIWEAAWGHWVTTSPHTGHCRYKNNARCQLGQTRVSANEMVSLKREGGSAFDYRSCVNERCAIRKEESYLSWQGQTQAFTQKRTLFLKQNTGSGDGWGYTHTKHSKHLITHRPRPRSCSLGVCRLPLTPCHSHVLCLRKTWGGGQ